MVDAELSADRGASDTVVIAGEGAEETALSLPKPGYRLGQAIGRGGYGLVREATQRLLQRSVAIKSLLAERSNARRRRAFYAEAVVTGLLQHPNIVPIYDCFEADGELRLVMKRIAGVAWSDLLHPTEPAHRQRAAQMELDDHLEFLVKVGEALHYAHDHGFLHRDLKPHNVMIGSYGEVLLMDWGCAVSYGDCRVEGVPHLDEHGRLAGTPAYMPPEMARGRTELLGPRSDVFQLGAMLYEVLTGVRPFASTSAQETLRLAARGKVLSPRKRAPERNIPAELAGLCRYAMRRDPAKRPASAREFVARLKAAIRHREADRLVERAQREMRRTNDEQGLERCARAQTCLEQALEIWSRCPAAQDGLQELGLRYAEAALAREAWQLAESQAQASLQRFDPADAAQADRHRQALEQLDRAQRGRREQQQRQRSIRRLRRLAWTLTLVTMCGLAALAGGALYSLHRFEQERQERQATEAKAIPAWLQRAGELIADGEAAGARELAELVAGLAPERAEPQLLIAQAALLADRRPAALAALRRYRELGGTTPVAPVIDTLQAEPVDEAALAAALAASGMHAATRGLTIATEDRLQAMAKGLEEYFDRQPGRVRVDVDRLAGGRLTVRLRGPVQDLDGLAGLPIEELQLELREPIDLAPLAGLEELRRLQLGGEAVDDLTALIGSAIEELHLTNTDVTSLAALGELPLQKLVLRYNDALSELAGLGGWPSLRSLHIDRSRRLQLDCGTLAATVEELAVSTIDGCSSLTALADLSLQRLSLAGIAGLRPEHLAGLSLQELRLVDCPGIAQLTGWLPASLRELSLVNQPISDLRPLAASGVTTLRLGLQQAYSLAPLADSPVQRLFFRFGGPATDLAALRAKDGLQIGALGETGTLAGFWPVFDFLQALDGDDGAAVLERVRVDDGRIERLDCSGLPLIDAGRIPLPGGLQHLDLSDTQVVDLEPLAGRRWRQLTLHRTPVRDLRSLQERTPVDLHIIGAELSGPEALAGLQSRQPWVAFLRGERSWEVFAKGAQRKGHWQEEALYRCYRLRWQGDEAAAQAWCATVHRDGDRGARRQAELLAAHRGWTLAAP